jgi:hypothetical protein
MYSNLKYLLFTFSAALSENQKLAEIDEALAQEYLYFVNLHSY